MKPLGIIGAVTLVAILCGCTSGAPDLAARTATPSPSAGAVGAEHVSLSGSFVSQAATTTGTVSILETSDKEFAIVLTDFSTGPSTDLRINLSHGALVADADGIYSVEGDARFELPGTIVPTDPDQLFVFPLGAWPEGDVESFTVYDYANRVAFGSAALLPADVSLPPWASAPITVTDSGTHTGATGTALPAGKLVDTYVVANGDTASDIASRFQVGLEQLIDDGGMRLGSNPTISPGDRIQFGTPLTGANYDCFFGLGAVPPKGRSCYE
ncbi:MAG: DM13 domain-containing protein [Rhodoglobus sp.]